MGLACREACEEQVRSLNQLIDRNIRLSPASEQVLGNHPGAYFAPGVFQILAGEYFGRHAITAVWLGLHVNLFLYWRAAAPSGFLDRFSGRRTRTAMRPG
jgi:hypothetical protein